MEFDDEGVAEFLEDLPFTEDRLELLFSDDFVLLHDFHGVEAASIFLSHKNHSRESAPPYHLYLFEVLLRNFLPLAQRDLYSSLFYDILAK